MNKLQGSGVTVSLLLMRVFSVGFLITTNSSLIFIFFSIKLNCNNYNFLVSLVLSDQS